jgi:hypothetical protein
MGRSLPLFCCLVGLDCGRMPCLYHLFSCQTLVEQRRSELVTRRESQGVKLPCFFVWPTAFLIVAWGNAPGMRVLTSFFGQRPYSHFRGDRFEYGLRPNNASVFNSWGNAPATLMRPGGMGKRGAFPGGRGCRFQIESSIPSRSRCVWPRIAVVLFRNPSSPRSGGPLYGIRAVLRMS